MINKTSGYIACMLSLFAIAYSFYFISTLKESKVSCETVDSGDVQCHYDHKQTTIFFSVVFVCMMLAGLSFYWYKDSLLTIGYVLPLLTLLVVLIIGRDQTVYRKSSSPAPKNPQKIGFKKIKDSNWMLYVILSFIAVIYMYITRRVWNGK